LVFWDGADASLVRRSSHAMPSSGNSEARTLGTGERAGSVGTLVNSAAERPLPSEGRHVVVAATFTSEPIADPFAACSALAALDFALQFAPYSHVFQELLTPGSALHRNTTGANVLLIRLEDFLRNRGDRESSTAASDHEFLHRTAEELARAILEFTQRSAVPLLVGFPHGSADPSSELGHTIFEATNQLVEAVGASERVTVLATEHFALWNLERPLDPVRDRLAHIPYSSSYYAAVAVTLTRELHRLFVPPHKVLVLDCDNTLWSGVVGEDGPEGITFPAGLLALQRFAVAEYARGTLICLCSKNVEPDVFEVFEKRAEMVLRPEHLVASRINWEPKAANLVALAKELNLGLESFVFVDDNPGECEQVRAALPEVLTIDLPAEAELEGWLQNFWPFDHADVTLEDSRRTALYRENAERRRYESSAPSIESFVAGLKLQIEVCAPTEEEWPRVAQLTHRTNQFNFTTSRRTESELRSLVDAGAIVLRVGVSDRFGDYGLVGVIVARLAAEELTVDTLLLSCRVLGKGVEHAMLRHLGEIAAARGLAHVSVPFKKTAKNEPARAFIESVAAPHRLAEGGDVTYRLPAELAAGIFHRAGADPDAVLAAAKTDSLAPKAKGLESSDKSARYQRLARVLLSPDPLLQLSHAQRSRVRPLSHPPTPPTSDHEARLLELWKNLLATPGLGVEDDYFELGGTSLLAVQLFAEIATELGVDLPLTTILEAPTVRQLARRLVAPLADGEGPLVLLKDGGERHLFLVHDGDGETLLYRHLALRMPEDVTVYGIRPFRAGKIELAHARLESMASDYLREVQRLCPQGPYLFGGLCAGGTIAFEMAAQLEQQGRQAGLVAIMDAAAPLAARRRGLVMSRRLTRLTGALAEHPRANGAPAHRLDVAGKKLLSVLQYEAGARLEALTARARFLLLERVLTKQQRWPDWVPPLAFRQIYLRLEARYRPTETLASRVVLLRAAKGEDGHSADQPYRELYADPELGWRDHVAGELEVIDVAGGHAGMLTEKHVASLAGELLRLLK
jgi:FkbH-like protein